MVLHLGLGLIGKSIQRQLCENGFKVHNQFKINWGHAEKAGKTLSIVAQEMAMIAAMEAARIDLIWSAGRAGFSAMHDDFETEMAVFQTLLSLAKDLSKAYSVHVHHFSSAGGLFEGQRFVKQDTLPIPRRPYGSIKLQQEDWVRALPPAICTHIYRPSSVYGYNGRGSRAGLITALAERGLAGQTVHIYGRPDTIRDYVYVEDIGVFVLNRILREWSDNEVCFLTAGKPTTMIEMLKIVQGLLKKRLFFRYIHDGGNTSHMSFDRGTFPTGWKPTHASIGLKKTILNIQRDFV